MINDPHFYGYYQYNNNRYVLREDALSDMILRHDLEGIMTFHFHDDIFENIDWTIDPPFSIDTLYKMRAQQIRDTYKYVILQLSGGVDSTQILETFINNNIFIDEIQTFHHYSATKNLNIDRDSPLFNEISVLYEYQYAVQPLLKWVKQVSPNTKISEIDVMDNVIEQFGVGSKGEMMGHTPITKNRINPPNLMFAIPRTVTYISFKHNIDRIEKDNVCVIRGIEKPALKPIRISRDRRLLGFNFHDQTMGSTNLMASGIMDKAFTLESFYWSPDAPLIPIKQSHMILNELRSNEKFKLLFLYMKEAMTKHRLSLLEKNTRRDSPLYQKLERLIYPIIYPSLQNVSFFGLKPMNSSPEMKLLDILGITHYGDEMKNEYNKHTMSKYDHIVNKGQMIDYIPTRLYFVGDF